MHNTPDDCWVSFLGMVYNITELIKVSVSQVQADWVCRCSCQNALQRTRGSARDSRLVVCGHASSDTILFDRSTHALRTLLMSFTGVNQLPLQENQGVLAAPLTAAAGQDISHWWGEQ